MLLAKTLYVLRTDWKECS